jgi:hypothetical protein
MNMRNAAGMLGQPRVHEDAERERTRAGVRALDVGTESERGCAALDEEHEPDVEERGAAEGVVAPLVAGRDERADETGDDHDEVHEDNGDDVGEREAGVEEQLEEQERRGDRPVDVTNILHDT